MKLYQENVNVIIIFFFGVKVERVQSEMKELSALAESNEGDKEMQDLAKEELQEARQKLLDVQEEVGII